MYISKFKLKNNEHCKLISKVSKGFCRKDNFPYLFTNNGHKFDIAYSMSELINQDFIEGFKFSYEHFLRAIQEKDYDFLEEVTEKEFGKKLINAIQNHKYKINIFPKSDDFEISVQSLQYHIHYFISSDRKQNKSIKVERTDIKNLPIISTLFKHQMGESIFMYKTTPFFQNVVNRYVVNIKSNLILSHNDIMMDENITETHRIIFEADVPPNEIFGLLNSSRIPKTFSSFLIKKDANVSFKIADFDGYMNGNPLV